MNYKILIKKLSNYSNKNNLNLHQILLTTEIFPISWRGLGKGDWTGLDKGDWTGQRVLWYILNLEVDLSGYN